MCAALTLGPFDSRLPGSTSWLLPMDAIVQAASVAIQPPSHSSPSPHCAPPAALPMPEAGAGSGGPGNNIDAWIAAINSVQARQSSDASEAQELGSHAAQALHVGEKRPRELAPHELDLMQQGLPPQGLSCCTGCWKCSCCGAFGTTRDAESGVRNPRWVHEGSRFAWAASCDAPIESQLGMPTPMPIPSTGGAINSRRILNCRASSCARDSSDSMFLIHLRNCACNRSGGGWTGQWRPLFLAWRDPPGPAHPLTHWGRRSERERRHFV